MSENLVGTNGNQRPFDGEGFSSVSNYQNLGTDCPQLPVPCPLPPAYSDGSELNLATFAAFAILEAILYDYGCERGAP